MNGVDLAKPIDVRAGRGAAVVKAVFTILSVAAGVSLLLWLAALVTNRARGLDVTDEAYYLLNARFPNRNIGTSTDFGFYLRPLLDLGTSLGGLRILGLVLVLMSACALSYAVTGWVPKDCPARPLAVTTVWTTVALTSTMYYGSWVPTPSYNLLTAVLAMSSAACLIGAARWQLAADPDLKRFDVDTALLGGCLAFGLVNKPTAFVAIGVIAVATLAFIVGRSMTRRLGAALVVGLTAAIPVHLLIVRSSPISDARRFLFGFGYLDLLEGHNAATTLETEFLRSDAPQWLIWLGVAAIVARSTRALPPRAQRPALALFASASFVPLAFQLPPGGWDMLGSGAGWWWIRLGSLALVWITASAAVLTRPLTLGPTVFLIGPAAAFGSNNGFIHQTALTPGLIIAAVMLQATLVASSPSAGPTASTRWIIVVPLGLAVAATFGLRADALESPYRLGGPLEASTEQIEFEGLGTMRVSPGVALYVATLRTLAGSVDAAARSCFVDLSGTTPVAALALDAKPAASVWLIGGYPGSEAAADYLLKRADCLDGPVLLLESFETGAIPRPEALDGLVFEEIGLIRFSGPFEDDQVLSISAGRP